MCIMMKKLQPFLPQYLPFLYQHQNRVKTLFLLCRKQASFLHEALIQCEGKFQQVQSKLFLLHKKETMGAGSYEEQEIIDSFACPPVK